MRSFAGRSVVITGAAGGLGQALVAVFLQAGARVLALDCNTQALVALREAMPPHGTDKAPTLATLVCDITQPQDCTAAITQAVALWGGVDVLVNNAGISHRSLFEDTDPAVLRKVMEVNFFGAVHMTHAALPQLLARRGVVAALSSVAGYAPLLGRTGYCASKHALHGFFDTLRTEVQERGVQVTLICPSFITTGIGAAALGASGAAATTPRITTGGESSPNDIAQRILAALAQGKGQLLPDRTSRLAWWVSRLAPSWYARAMQRRVRAEFEP
ncbi:MAG: SDR family oxidoreductase [Simplicispira suum]|uniref:SDR family oxidoreductase n=1 Tax=Simplicispira suum TaxID=2109915 RepID=UPI001C6BC1E7|nr:SDR family oxidoreductase [Simplicispira suum]MBW7834910.1 SDR family oxidoreductase [Simplicispira suum]